MTIPSPKGLALARFAASLTGVGPLEAGTACSAFWTWVGFDSAAQPRSPQATTARAEPTTATSRRRLRGFLVYMVDPLQSVVSGENFTRCYGLLLGTAL